MVLDLILLDALRVLHLTFFAAGMGTCLFHDFLTFRSMADPITHMEITAIEKLHQWVRFAFTGLWVTGVMLIYVRTSFDLANFSPKLWTKVSLMILMSLNSLLIGRYVLPLLKKNLGKSMVAIAPRDLRAATGIASVSLFGWSSGMILGASMYLKTAPWEILVPSVTVWFALCMFGGQLGVVLMRAKVRTKPAGDEQVALNLK